MYAAFLLPTILSLALAATAAPSAAKNNIPTGPKSFSLRADNLTDWPPPPFAIEFGDNRPYKMEVITTERLIPSLADPVQTLLENELQRLEQLPRRQRGPPEITLEGPDGKPWFKCKRSRNSRLEIAWRNTVAIKFISALQIAIRMHGFIEMEFDIVDPRPGKGRFAHCVLIEKNPYGGQQESGGFLGNLLGNETVSGEFVSERT